MVALHAASPNASIIPGETLKVNFVFPTAPALKEKWLALFTQRGTEYVRHTLQMGGKAT